MEAAREPPKPPSIERRLSRARWDLAVEAVVAKDVARGEGATEGKVGATTVGTTEAATGCETSTANGRTGTGAAKVETEDVVAEEDEDVDSGREALGGGGPAGGGGTVPSGRALQAGKGRENKGPTISR